MSNENGKLFSPAEAAFAVGRILERNAEYKSCEVKAALFCSTGRDTPQYTAKYNAASVETRTALVSLYESAIILAHLGGHHCADDITKPSPLSTSFDCDAIFMQYYTMHQAHPRRDTFTYFLTDAQYGAFVNRIEQAIKGHSDLVVRGSMLMLAKILMKQIAIPLAPTKITRFGFTDDDVAAAGNDVMHQIQYCRSKEMPAFRHQKKLPIITSQARVADLEFNTDKTLIQHVSNIITHLIRRMRNDR